MAVAFCDTFRGFYISAYLRDGRTMATDQLSALVLQARFDYATAHIEQIIAMCSSVSAVIKQLPYKVLQVAFTDFDGNIAKLRKLGEKNRVADVLGFEEVRPLPCATDGNLHTTLLWINRGLSLVVRMIEKTLREPRRDIAVREIYQETLSQYHGWTVRTAVSALGGSTINLEQLNGYLKPRDGHLEQCRDGIAAYLQAFAFLETRPGAR